MPSILEDLDRLGFQVLKVVHYSPIIVSYCGQHRPLLLQPVEYSCSYKLSVVTLLSSAQELQSPYADTRFFQLKSRGRALDVDHHRLV